MAALNSPFLLLLATIALFLHTNTAANVPASHPGPGEYEPIPVDNCVEELAKFAVEEHNTRTGDHLVYSKTLTAEKQEVDGNNYRLVISANRANQKPQNYQAVVFVPFYAKSLTSFNKGNVPASHPGPGQYEPIPVDQCVEELAKFAVEEYNEQTGDHLVYSKTLSAEKQKVDGNNYRLVISANRANQNSQNYKAVVFVPFYSKILTSFHKTSLPPLQQFIPIPNAQNNAMVQELEDAYLV